MTQDQIPSLRFPEFQGAWEIKPLGELCEIATGKLDANAMVENGQYRFYTCAKNYYFIDDYAFDTDALLISGNGANVGYIHHYKGKFNAYQRTYVLDKFPESILFIKHYLDRNLHKRIFVEKKEGNTPYIVKSTLADMNIMLPHKDEQDKITECLSSLDELITIHGDRLDGLKDYKMGLMQQLFPAKGQTTPALRFPEFQGKDPWQEKRLAEVCSKIPQGGTPDTTKPDYWNGSINWLTPAEMGKTKDRFMHTTVRKITELGLKKCSSDLLPINSIIVSTRAPIGYLTINKTEMAFNQGCKGLVPNKTTSYDFLYYTLLFYKNSLIALGSGSTFKELTGNSLKNFKVTFPSLEEQKKIADCLSVMDDLITEQEQIIKDLKHHKNGLMQQLFPKMEEL